jgi:hypothetical protein
MRVRHSTGARTNSPRTFLKFAACSAAVEQLGSHHKKRNLEILAGAFVRELVALHGRPHAAHILDALAARLTAPSACTVDCDSRHASRDEKARPGRSAAQGDRTEVARGTRLVVR